MFVIVDIAGQQFRVSKDDQIIAPKINGEVGSEVEFDKVLFMSSEKDGKIGTPFVDGAKVQATIMAQEKAKKVVVFKKKRRKTYRVLNGHRQEQTRLKIGEIVA